MGIAKEKEYIDNLLFPSYDINQILEPEENEEKPISKPISIMKNNNNKPMNNTNNNNNNQSFIITFIKD